ncbi:MAG: acyl-CoA/acyl-ACP dehydrogenase [Chloroflexota bacterium]|nr:acyl-CoA/acyl-ACP dehydrogenase [Chloroflexota bacterium]
MDTIKDPQFGDILDYDRLRAGMMDVLDNVYPSFNLMGSMLVATRHFKNNPSYMTACAASGLAYMMLVAAEEYELARELKGKIFTLSWTEEHTGTDLLSVRTRATPLSDDPLEKDFHIQGQKWLINNSYHADYHSVIAKVDPSANGPRSLSLFAVPHSSTRNWQRLETHVLRSMVLTKFDIDGPGILIGQVGRGLEILQRMALPSKYHCAYMGVKMVDDSLPAAIDHLSNKNIFGNNPIRFSNVFRQLYNLALGAALINFTFFRALAFSDSPFLQFHGIMLKSWLLLKCNDILSQNLLVTGSKGFLKESNIGGNAIDSFVYPVFDGHYTLNTLLTYKHTRRYLRAKAPGDLAARITVLRENAYVPLEGKQILNNSRETRHPPFFDYADYVARCRLPMPLDAAQLIRASEAIMDAIQTQGLTNEPEYRYKIGMLVHNLEALLSAVELWKVTENEHYLNAIIMQYNEVGKLINRIISEGDLAVDFIKPLRQLPLPQPEDPRAFLLDLLDVKRQIRGG